MNTEERRRQIAEQVAREQKRLNDKPTGVWSPTITEAEKEQRKKDIDAGIIPF
jgi:hypothetical protein